MVSSRSYLFALAMGIVAVILTHLQARSRQETVPRSTYIKHFIVGTSISLATLYFGGGTCLGKSVTVESPVKSFQPEIMTGNPNF